MRSLSDTLLATQKSPTSVPYCKVEIRNRIASATRLDWGSLYQGSEEDYHHALTMPGDGSLIRARTTSTGAGYIQRVTSPGESSDFSQWTSFLNTGVANTPIALCSFEEEVIAFIIGSDGHIYRRESDDFGATWGDWIDTGLAPGTGNLLAATMKPNHDVCLLYSQGASLYTVKRENGSWGSPQGWTNSLNSITGITLAYAGDWNVVITGTDPDGKKGVWSCVYGDGYSMGVGSWSSLRDIMLAESDSDLEYKFPFVDYPDVFRLWFVEKYTATQPYSRPYRSHSLPTAEFISDLWREPVPFNLSSEYGIAIAHSGSYTWLSTPFCVWRANLLPVIMDITQDILSLRAESTPYQGNLIVELRNDQGQHASFSKKGCEILVSPGYKTPAGNEYSTGPSFWIESWEYSSLYPSRSTLIVRAVDAWGILENWRARRQYQWSAGDRNIYQLLAFIFSRAGLEIVAVSSSPFLSNHKPAFTIHPGENGARAVKRLLETTPDVLFFCRNEAFLKYPQPDDVTDYTYGEDHPVLEGRYSQAPLSENRVQVYGQDITVEEFAWDEIEEVYDRLAQVYDPSLTTVEKAQQRAQAGLRKIQMQSAQGNILVPVNCGQELWDVVEITDARAGLSQKSRVTSLTMNYSTSKPEYSLRITLGGL